MKLADRLTAVEPQVLTQPVQARAVLQGLLAEARATLQREQQAQSLCLLGRCAFFQGDYLATLGYAQEARELAQATGQRPLEACALNSLGMARGRLGQPDQAMEALTQSLLLTVEEGDEALRGSVLTSMGMIHERLEEYHQALDLYREGLEIAQKQGKRVHAGEALAGMISSLRQLGRHRESQRLVLRALNWCRSDQMPRVEANLLYNQTLNLLALGETPKARASAERGIGVAEAIGDQEALGELLWALGEVYLASGNLAAARRALHRCERLAQLTGNPLLECHAKASLSKIFERQGHFRQAVEYVRAQQVLEGLLRARQTEQRALLLSGQIKMEVVRREAELQRERNAELARANSALRRIQVELTHRASRDQLTGVANRAYFLSRVQKALEHRTPGRYLGLIFADIDHLKAVNDRFGHAAGDRLISELAQRMRANLYSGDLVGRLSGDEFMILLSDMAHPDDIDLVATKLLRVLREPVEHQGQQIPPTLSMGCVVAPDDGLSLEVLHRHADLALYQAKAQGRNAAVRFTTHMSAEEQERRQLEQDLRRAVSLGQLELHYQGQFLLPGYQLSGFEALVRWPHPELGMISPARFIPLAEESQLILELGDWVLNEACRQASEWGLAQRGVTMAVNVSARQFGQPDFVAGVQRCLERHGLPGQLLILELTESMVHRDPELASAAIRELQSLGIRIAMDDFGTGYSSLSMLKNLPFEQLKIAREFLQDLYAEAAGYQAAMQFVEVIVQFAHNLGMRVLAEGVETAEQYDILASMGCDEGQGYWLARPLPGTEAARLLPPLPGAGGAGSVFSVADAGHIEFGELL